MMTAETAGVHSREEADRLYRKITLRVMPFLVICYLTAYLDRANISFAKLQFMSDLGFSEAAYGFGAGLFFAGYILFEVPSNMIMQRVGARRTLARIMILWGLISAGMMFVNSPVQLYVMRFFLGAAEAGFFPGMIYYFTFWYPSRWRGRVVGYLTMGAAGAGIIGAPVSTWMMVHLAGIYDLKGWQWLFLLEGMPAAVLGAVAFFFLTDRPESATWLSQHEKAIIKADLADAGDSHNGGLQGLRGALGNPMVYVGIVVYFCIMMPFNAITFWMPTLLKDIGTTDLFQIGLLSSLVFFAGGLGTYLVGRSSDRTMERRWHLAACCVIIATSFALLPLASHSVAGTVALLACACLAAYGGFVVFWTVPPMFLPGESKATGIALITSLGGIGAFVSPTLVGLAKTEFGTIYAGLITLGVVAVIGALIIIIAIKPPSSGKSA